MKMKRILYILSGLLLLTSCLQEINTPRIDMPATDGTSVDGEFITVNFDVSFAEEAAGRTKAMADDPSISSLRIAVFDQYNMLETCVEATSLGPVEGTGSTYPDRNLTTWKYQATFPKSTERRYLHFLANVSDELVFGSEDELIGKLTTSGDQDAYWQRTVAENGINVDEEGKLIEEARAALTNVALVRNFAKITVTTSSSSNFILKYACLMNRPTSGTVAPYNSGVGAFIDEYQTKTVSELRAAKYDAWMPANCTMDETRPGTLPGDTAGWQAAVDGAATEFTYERETPTRNACFVLVYGTYSGQDYYYKIDLIDKEGQYFPILRNFNYTVNILSVNAEGRKTVDDAINMQGSGSISVDVDAKNLVNISDGVSRMSVSFTEISVVSGEPFEFRYKFVPDFQNAPNTYDNNIVAEGETIQNETGKRLSLVKDAPGAGGDVFDFTINNSQTADSDGYYTIMIEPVDPGNGIKSQKMTLTGMAVDGTTISRDITVIVREKQPLKLFCDEATIRKISGTEFDVVLQLPGGLTEMMFPLEIEIEAGNLTIAPVAGENLPVGSGKSIALADPENDPETTVDKTAFHFTRTITWEEYYDYVNESGIAHALEADGTKHFRCHFKSNTAVSATTIWAANKYFYTGSAELGNYDPHIFENLKFAKGSSFVPDEEAIFTFDFDSEEAFKSLSDNDMPVTVTLVGLEPAPGSSLKPIKASTAITNGYEYEYTPTGVTSNTIVLTSTSATGPYNVYLDAYHFEQAKGVGGKKFTINKGALTFTSASGGPFYKSTKNDTNKNVYVRTDENDADMTSSPATSVARESSYGYYTTYSYRNGQAITDVVAFGDYLYFLYEYNSKVYVGRLDISSYTGDTNAITSGTVTFELRKTQRQISVEDKTLKAGESYTPTIAYTPSGAAGGTVSYTSSKPDVVAVSGTTLTAKSVGTATITATVAGNDSYAEASCTFKVTVNKGDAAVTPKETNVEIGVSKDLTLSFTYTAGYTGNFEVISADEHRVSVSEVKAQNGSGTVKLHGVASTSGVKISIKAIGNANYNASNTAEVNVKVVKLDPKLSAKLASDSMKPGSTQKITVTKESDATASFKSSNESVATVDANGNVKALAIGTATITVAVVENDTYLAGSTTVSLTVKNKKTVSIAAGSLTFTNDTDSSLFGEDYDTDVSKLKVYVSATPAYDTSESLGSTTVNQDRAWYYYKYLYSFENAGAMTLEVDPDVSTLYFMVQDGNGRTYYASVGVDDAGNLASTTLTFTRFGKYLTDLSISGEGSVKYGETIQLKATATFSDGSSLDVTNECEWTSSQPTRATVSDRGVVTGKRDKKDAKTTTITAKYTYDGDTLSATKYIYCSK